jgi:hypothetical protein
MRLVTASLTFAFALASAPSLRADDVAPRPRLRLGQLLHREPKPSPVPRQPTSRKARADEMVRRTQDNGLPAPLPFPPNAAITTPPLPATSLASSLADITPGVGSQSLSLETAL